MVWGGYPQKKIVFDFFLISLGTPTSTPHPPHTPGSRLRHMVNERPVRILMECILVPSCGYMAYVSCEITENGV